MGGNGGNTGEELGPAGEGQALLLDLDGYSGPLDRLLGLARDHKINLARLSLPALVEQMAAALGQAVPLGQKAAWVAMIAWLLQLRSRLLLPADAPAQKTARSEAGRLRGRLVQLRAVQGLAAWLDAQPQLGRDVFARGQAEMVGLSFVAEHEANVIEFLWAVMALFHDEPLAADTTRRYQPHRLDLHSIPDARLRIMRLLADHPNGQMLDRLLPDVDVCAQRVATRTGHGFTDDAATRSMHREFAAAEVDERHVLRDLSGGPDAVAQAVLERQAGGALRWR